MATRAILTLRIPGFCRVEAHLSDDEPAEPIAPGEVVEAAGEVVQMPGPAKARPRLPSGVIPLQLASVEKRRAS